MSEIATVEAARNAVHNIQPQRVDGYVDKIQLWLETPLTPAQLKRVKRQCGGRLHAFNERMRYNANYTQRIQLQQPRPHELRLLNRLKDSLLNGVEIALDWIFPDHYGRDAAFELVCRHHVTRHHGDQQVVWERHGNVRYTGRQGAPNLLAMYRDKVGRIAQDEYVVHLDWRINGVPALRRTGITSLIDLIGFKHRKFWRKRLLLQAIEPNRFGRMYHEQAIGRSRRGPWIGDFEAAHVILRAEKEVQKVIDKYGKRMDVQACLHTIEVGHLLPRLRQRPVGSAAVRMAKSMRLESVQDRFADGGQKIGECVGETRA